MDDGKLANGMTFEVIAKELREIKASVDELRELKTSVQELRETVQSGFERVDLQLNNAKIRDEEILSLAKFSLEANDALRETMETRFTEVGKKLDDEVSLLKDVLRDRSRTRR